MSTTLYAVFDGEVLRPDEPLQIAPNTPRAAHDRDSSRSEQASSQVVS